MDYNRDMKITVKRSGGFAGPLTQKTFVLESGAFPPAVRRKLEALIAARPLASIRAPKAPPRGAADLLKYEVAIETAEGEQRIAFHESAVPREFQAVWDLLAPRLK
jgi:hypothetical protein